MKQQKLSVLSNVISVARRELADREDKEIPAKMRMVAKRGGGRLPPPLQASVVKELRANDAFRESVLERWESEGIEDPVGHAFLDNPEDALEKVSKEAASQEIAGLEAELDGAARTIGSLEDQIAEAKSRLADTVEVHGTEIAKHAAAATASRASLDKRVRSLLAHVTELEDELQARASVGDDLRSEIDDLAGKLERSVTRARKKAQKDHVRVHQPMAPPSDPVELAAWLDSVEKQQRSFRQARGADTAVDTQHPPLRIPGGLLPDSHHALTALMVQKPEAIFVDGYNVGAMLEDDFSTSKARTRVVAIAERLASVSKARVVVVFDAVGVEGRKNVPSSGKAEVRFTHTQIADDEIVDLIQVNTSRVAVITSDRELSNRCAAEGCVTVWSEALVQWAGR